ncbi:DUF305 domain-containing protein [Mycolicibacterium arenosum]|uniref:DUF305 domain-containing protein n=1 Tax=Mycolicibacterium arenosum TaxID=2952157 RepID=A0ABT1M235_9MYCO|nr:DUF305 domain-containing protein [Mycolicibacterium sp. CAU 1645]MCP9272522.1 DUF305 domain-containing protein [Mycolicibacterium sp. CAU 1645]
MQHKRCGVGLAALAASTLFVGACSNTGAKVQPSASSASTTASAPSSAAAHNDADVSFGQKMIPHHQQAIEMSDMILVPLAGEIKNAQGPEIELMQRWLQDWGASATPAPGGAGMPGHDMPGAGMGDMPMVGGGHSMMSQADMTAHQDAQGAEAGRLFLTQMIAHHRGAIVMARNIVSSQQAEIETMQKMLDK